MKLSNNINYLQTGSVVLAATLDREMVPSYSLLARVYDNYQYGLGSAHSRHAFTRLAVTVTDVNDEKPQFEVEEERGPGECVPVSELQVPN